jgi:hypothetical protein
VNRAEAAELARAARAAAQPPLDQRFWSKVSIQGPKECWPWVAAFRSNRPGYQYGAFWLNGRHHPAPRVALMLSGVSVPDTMEVCHRCDNPQCVNPAHLFIGTGQENMDDKVAKGRQVKGGRVHTAKLTSEQVAEIRAAKPAGQRAPNGLPALLAKKYGVTKQYLCEIWSEKSWRQS